VARRRAFRQNLRAVPESQREGTPPAGRVVVATDRSATADQAVEWAARMAEQAGAELVLLQVLPPAQDGEGAGEDGVGAATAALEAIARERAGERGRAMVVVDADPAAAITRAAADAGADVLVVGNVGMRGRTRFLLGNIPNRVSHNAPCTVVIVRTEEPPAPAPGAERDALSDEALLRRAVQVAVKLAAHLGRKRRPDGDGTPPAESDAAALRALLEELGPTFS
jgi:ubiquinone biosynthesis protein